jgi:hypothetical protein
MARIYVVFRGNPAQCDPGFYLIDPSRAALGTGSAGGAAPHLFLFYLGQAEGALSDQLAHAEVPNPVPGTDNITHPALVAELERIAAVLFNDIYYFFKGGYGLHVSTCPDLSN